MNKEIIEQVLHDIDTYFDNSNNIIRDSNNLIQSIYENLSGEIKTSEWRLDWSQAPIWANWWCADKIGIHWFEYEPKYVGNFEWYDDGVGKYKLAPSFNYQGNWKDSLHKRT